MAAMRPVPPSAAAADCAFIAEPVMGAGGVIAPPKTYFEKVSPYTILGMYKKCIDIL
ncbi:hypothetical protein OsJ_31036 [Oryza sativa Japonica Group]|uniref:Uncharacterized protein n=1 Tax=Oryza sativa subsp. japonica TaxID=39947 RepID=A3C3G5_ORYSJ|nr:hypothetical protein OsJ_31036 [Oryza sativa Japonica Group]